MRAAKTVVSCSPKSAVAGSSDVITCKAKVTGYLPTGTVHWTQIGTGSVSLNITTCILVHVVNSTKVSTCSVSMTGTTAGKVTLRATYNGDPNNLGKYKVAKLKIKP
jgi:hypothetical protein